MSQDGIRATNAVSPPVQVTIDHTQIMVTNIGIEAAQHSRFAVSNSLVSKSANDGVKAGDVTSSDAQMTIETTSSEYNVGDAFDATTGSSVSVGWSKTAFNSGCGLHANGGNMFTFTEGANGTNRGHGNTGGNTCGTVTPVTQF